MAGHLPSSRARSQRPQPSPLPRPLPSALLERRSLSHSPQQHPPLVDAVGARRELARDEAVQLAAGLLGRVAHDEVGRRHLAQVAGRDAAAHDAADEPAVADAVVPAVERTSVGSLESAARNTLASGDAGFGISTGTGASAACMMPQIWASVYASGARKGPLIRAY